MWHTCLVNRGYAVWVIYEYENSTDYIGNKSNLSKIVYIMI